MNLFSHIRQIEWQDVLVLADKNERDENDTKSKKKTESSQIQSSR